MTPRSRSRLIRRDGAAEGRGHNRRRRLLDHPRLPVTSSMNDSAARVARTAPRPLCVIHHAMCHRFIFDEEEAPMLAARARENQNEEAV